MTMSESDIAAARLAAKEAVSMPRWKLARIERRLAKARQQRDMWRGRAQAAESITLHASFDWSRKQNERLRAELNDMKRGLLDKILSALGMKGEPQ